MIVQYRWLEIQMQMDTDTDTNTDGYRYRWIQMDRDTDTGGHRYNMDEYRWINFNWNSRFDGWIDCDHDTTIQIDKLFNFMWNSRFDGWIDYIHDCIHSTIQMDRDTDGYRYNMDGYR